MILNWFKKLFKKPDAAHHDLWDHMHWPFDDDFEIPRLEGEMRPAELTDKDNKRSSVIPHPHKGKRKGRRKVGSHIRRARHKRKHAKR